MIINFINNSFIDKLCFLFNIHKLNKNINNYNYDSKISIFNSNLIMKRYVIIIKDNIKYVIDKFNSNIRISFNKNIYIIPFWNNTFIRFYKSYYGLTTIYIDYSQNFYNIFSFNYCYVHQTNMFNKLLKNIYQYNKITINFNKFKQFINELINIIKADIMLYML